MTALSLVRLATDDQDEMLDGGVGSSSSGGRSLMIAPLAVWAIAVALSVIVGLSMMTVLRANLGVQDQSFRIEWYDDWPKRYAWLGFPPPASEPGERRDVARETCAAQSVASLAWGLETRATPGAVARRYARWSGKFDAAVYEGCLTGFGEGR